MIPVEFAHFKEFDGDYHEDDKTDNLLNDFELHQIERSTGDFRADAVGRNHHEILEKSDAPAG